MWKKAYRFIFICHIKCTSGCETGFSGIWKMSAGEIFRIFKQVNMAQQEQNTEWTQKNFFFYFYFAYYMCKHLLLTHSGEEDERKWEFRIICVSVKRLHILVMSGYGELSYL